MLKLFIWSVLPHSLAKFLSAIILSLDLVIGTLLEERRFWPPS